MTSYRGIETVDCVGIQPSAEPVHGYVKTTNRIDSFESKENALSGPSSSVNPWSDKPSSASNPINLSASF